MKKQNEHGSMFDSLKKEITKEAAKPEPVKPVAEKPEKKEKPAQPEKQETVESKPVPQKEPEPSSAPLKEEISAMSIRIPQKYDIFVKIMSSRKRMVVNEFMRQIVEEEAARVKNGDGPDAYEIHFHLPPRENPIQRHILLPKELIDFIDEQTHYLGIKKTQYISYLLAEECKRKIESGEYIYK